MPLRVLVADDNDVVRSSIMQILKENPHVEVVGQSISYAQTMELAATLKPDVLLLDLLMPDEGAFSQEDVKQHLLHNTSCVLAISIFSDDDAKRRAENMGAKALLDKANLYGELNRWITSLCTPK
jgi:DNA-binding NarL/FixJ family response regulator